ncbi:MAG: CDP-alcohol phosphatidyltransferase family protein [Chloroflexi bacterium]|nr:CDP-alcohol phosphatidyltransferase family protein [Chloroflexota bacterium]
MEAGARGLALRPARLLSRLGATPNQITVSGLLLSAGAGALLALGQFPWAGALLLVAGALDLLDGALARLSGQATPFGAVLDSTVDRASEALVLGGLLAFYGRTGPYYLVLLVFSFLVGSFLVSYVRARAEAAGLKGETGVLPRGERVVLLALALFLGIVPWVLGLLTVLAFVTVLQRLALVWRQSRG